MDIPTFDIALKSTIESKIMHVFGFMALLPILAMKEISYFIIV